MLFYEPAFTIHYFNREDCRVSLMWTFEAIIFLDMSFIFLFYSFYEFSTWVVIIASIWFIYQGSWILKFCTWFLLVPSSEMFDVWKPIRWPKNLMILAKAPLHELPSLLGLIPGQLGAFAIQWEKLLLISFYSLCRI